MKPPDSTPDPFDRFDTLAPRDPEEFRAAVEALRDHYAELGDAENLRRMTVVLTAEEPWREGHRGPPVTDP